MSAASSPPAGGDGRKGCLAPGFIANSHQRTAPPIFDYKPTSKSIKSITALGTPPWDTPDPFLFLVYHKDMFPPGNERMEAPRRGNGADFNPSAPYRMYHGEKIPGFPQHPHRGFETITATMKGLIDHSDSFGNGGRYGEGDLQWMTAGKGVVHGEMFPLVNATSNNECRFFQIWINLPAKNKMVDPDFKMHWAPNVPKVASDDGLGKVTVFAGDYFGHVAEAPPSNSWAADPENYVALYHCVIQPGGKVMVPACKGGNSINRNLYFFEGQHINVAGKSLRDRAQLDVAAGEDILLHNEGGDTAELLVLQGRPIGERVAQHGPFVMNTQQEIRQAFADYQTTQFGGWPWKDDAVVFPRTKGRFAKFGKEEEYPPIEEAA